MKILVFYTVSVEIEVEVLMIGDYAIVEANNRNVIVDSARNADPNDQLTIT